MFSADCCRSNLCTPFWVHEILGEPSPQTNSLPLKIRPAFPKRKPDRLAVRPFSRVDSLLVFNFDCLFFPGNADNKTFLRFHESTIEPKHFKLTELFVFSLFRLKICGTRRRKFPSTENNSALRQNGGFSHQSSPHLHDKNRVAASKSQHVKVGKLIKGLYQIIVKATFSQPPGLKLKPIFFETWQPVFF